MRRQFLTGVLATTGLFLTACFEAPKPAAPPKAPLPPPQPKAPPAPPPYTGPDTVRVVMQTEKGEIVLELEAKKAPITTANFLRYLDAGKIEGAEFWRAMKSGESGFVQAHASGIKFPPIAHEPTSKTGLSHTSGTISMGRYDVGTASNEFTISVGDMTYMDAGRDDPDGYAAFGKVISGMSIVRKILGGKITKKKIEGGWDGQMLAVPVKVVAAKRIEP